MAFCDKVETLETQTAIQPNVLCKIDYAIPKL
jgi:hypothetical protein